MTRQHHPAFAAPATAATPTGTAAAGATHPSGPAIAPVRRTDFEAGARALASWYLEFRAGRRQVDQVRHLVTPALRQRLQARAGLPRVPLPPQPILRTRVQRCSPGRVEAVVVAQRPGRVSAVMVSFQREAGGWLATDLTCPEEAEAFRRPLAPRGTS